MNIKAFYCSSLMLCVVSAAKSQTSTNNFHSTNQLQYGLTIKACLLFDFSKQHPNPYFRIGADTGIGASFISNWLYEAVNTEFQFYDGGLGTRSANEHVFKLDFEILPAFTLTAGWGKSNFGQNRFVNLYYFSNYARPALRNPYDHSLSIGTVISIVFDTAKKTQRIGFLGINASGGAQFVYYNDGSVPFKQLYLGDGDDRYQTGGGLLSYNGPRNSFVNDLELSYHKYTGFSQSAFEAANKLYLAYNDYHLTDQIEFNRSQYDLTLANPYRGYALQVQWYNSVGADLQHDIHTAVLDAYHLVPYHPDYWTIGLSYFFGTEQNGSK